MIRQHAQDSLPAEIPLGGQKVIPEVPGGATSDDIGEPSENQNPCRKEMNGPVPDRGTDDKWNGKIDQGRGIEVAGFAPVQARVGYENTDAARKQGKYAERGDPMGDADNQETARRL